MGAALGRKGLVISFVFLLVFALSSCARTGVESGLSSDDTQLGTSRSQIVPAREFERSGALPSLEGFVSHHDLQDIHFAFDRSVLTHESIAALNRDAEWFKKNPTTLILIEGHADERGTNEYNLALGERRAKAAKDYLVSVGIKYSRVSQISYGEERPVCKESTEECWAKNRRDHFMVKMQ